MPTLNVDLAAEIRRLKKERNAIILAHNYQVPEIQEVADYVGDSLGLAFKASETDAEVIAFCGVHFMAEVAKIINPEKTVVLPDLNAGCSLEEACPGPVLEAYLEEHADKNYYVIAYINCSAHVKSLCDVICTSGNAVRIVEQAPKDRPILFVPDENLGQWVIEQTGRPMDLWRGACFVHVEFTQASINKLKAQHPGALLVAHPECTKAVRMLADEVCSTSKMIDFCRKSSADTFIIATEEGMLHPLRKAMPDKTFLAGPSDACGCATCPFMKLNTMEKLYQCLDTLEPQIVLEESLRLRAEMPLLKMLEQSK